MQKCESFKQNNKDGDQLLILILRSLWNTI